MLDAGAEAMAWDESGGAPLHRAAQHGTPASIQTLLAAGAVAKAKEKSGKSLWEIAQEYRGLKGFKTYWALN